jgi:methylmalonyl-CoA mutase
MTNQNELLSEFSIPTYEEWKKAAEDALKGVPFEKKLITKTYENIDLQPIYNVSDRDIVAYTAESLPGSFPYTRGICASGYKGKAWDISQAFSYPLPTMLNKALKEDLQCGQTGITISACNCRAMSDKCDCKCECEDFVCSCVQINDIKDLEDLFDGIDITKYSIKFLQTCPVPYSLELATLFIAYCKKHNIKSSDLRVNFGFDITPFIVRNGNLSNPIELILDDMAALVKLANASGDKFSAISIDGCTYHNSGANAVQEIAYSVATGVYYIKELMNRGLGIDEIAKNIHFNFSSGVKFFIEISKLRAARIIWAKIIKSFGGNEDSQKMIIHAFTSKINKTKFDPYVNILRGTTEGLAAVLSGACSLNIGTFDEELGMPSDFSRRIARNVQNILKDEAHLIDTIDPAGGSYYIETLTDKFATESWKIFREVEGIGCIFEALHQGKIQADIEAVVAKRQDNIANRRDVILGTNKHPNLIEKPVEGLVKVTPAEAKKHIEEVKSRKKTADFAGIWKSPWNERAEKMIEAYSNGAILADIWLAKEQKDCKTEWSKPIPAFRAAELFEGLRNAADTYKAKTGKVPQIYFEAFGLLKQYKPRVDFSTDFFAVAGFDIIVGKGFENATDAIANIGNISAPVVVICSNDDIYPEVVPAYAEALKKQKPDIKLFLAGLPKDFVDSFKAAGVDEFIHIKSNVYETLSKLFAAIGIM